MITYVGLRDLGEGLGEIPVYSDEYMPLGEVYIIGIPGTEPSKFLLDPLGFPLSVPTNRNLKRVGIVNPEAKGELTLTDYSAPPESRGRTLRVIAWHG
jgi:hypothetical protein